MNRALAQALFGRDDVTGESLPLSSTGQGTTQIVGVVEDLSFGHPSAEVTPMAFVTSIQGTPVTFAALIKSASTSAQLEQQLRRLADSGAIELPPLSVRPLTTLRASSLAGDIARAFGESTHGRALADAGFVEDLVLCGGIDTHPVVPVYAERQITKLGTERGR